MRLWLLRHNKIMILDLPYILETRRNHALEHATLHMLARTHKINMAGHSNPTGFFIFGELLTEDIRSALNEAYRRLRAGERGLAIHPGCGTNLVATAFLPGTLACLWLYPEQATGDMDAAQCHHGGRPGEHADRRCDPRPKRRSPNYYEVIHHKGHEGALRV
jgi:hypothetical protein